MCVTHKEPSAEEVFGAQVRFAREAREWSQDALARHLREKSDIGMDQAAVARLERGKRAIRLNEAVALAALLGLDLGQYGSAIDLSEESYREAREELDRIRALEQQATEALERGRRVVSMHERDLARLRDNRLRLEAAIRAYEERASGER